MIRFCIEFGDEQLCKLVCNREDNDIWLVPKLGRFTEQAGPATKTPEFHKPFRSRKARKLLMFSMSATQQVDLSITATDKKGNPAQLQDVTWSTDNSDVLALTPSADGMTCTVAAVGPLTAAGTPARVTMTADADMGAGVVPLIGFLDVEIVAGQATVVSIVPGTPVEQP